MGLKFHEKFLKNFAQIGEDGNTPIIRWIGEVLISPFGSWND